MTAMAHRNGFSELWPPTAVSNNFHALLTGPNAHNVNPYLFHRCTKFNVTPQDTLNYLHATPSN